MPPTPSSEPPCAASIARLGQLEIRWKAPCAPATSRPGSAPVRRRRRSLPPRRPPLDRVMALRHAGARRARPHRGPGAARVRPARRPARARRGCSATRSPSGCAPATWTRDRRVGRLAARRRPMGAGRRLPLRGQRRHAEFLFDAAGPLRGRRGRRGALAGRRAEQRQGTAAAPRPAPPPADRGEPGTTSCRWARTPSTWSARPSATADEPDGRPERGGRRRSRHGHRPAQARPPSSRRRSGGPTRDRARGPPRRQVKKNRATAVGAELGRDHVRRREERLTSHRPGRVADPLAPRPGYIAAATPTSSSASTSCAAVTPEPQ